MQKCYECKHCIKLINYWCCRLFGKYTCQQERYNEIQYYECCGKEAIFFEKKEREYFRE